MGRPLGGWRQRFVTRACREQTVSVTTPSHLTSVQTSANGGKRALPYG